MKRRRITGRLALFVAAISIGHVSLVWAQGPRDSTAPGRETASADRAAQPASRPRLGLALGGGAARGLAHIGLLRWFEEHRIPIDLLAGTSMGGLVGGAYASGMTPDEIQAVMNGTDWDLMFLSESPYEYKTFRRKEDARAFPGQIDLGLKGGITLPSGLNAGQQIELMLDRIALPYYGVTSFDDLPTPFRCVAADIRKAEPLVLGSGSLSRALRATMAIPAAFTPVVMGDRVLVDGGTLNNVPADVVKAMGADVVIAVNVSSTTDPAPAANTLFRVFGQTFDAMMVSSTREALESADVIVVPDLAGLTGGDWRRTDALVARGYAAAEAMSAQLLKYQLDETSYLAWMRERQSRRRDSSPMVASVLVEGVPAAEAGLIAERLLARHGGRPFDRPALEESLLQLSGSDRYELIAYTMRAGASGPELVVQITSKSYGPPFLLPALDLQNIDSNSFAVNLRARLVAYDTLVPNSEWRVDGGVGTNREAAIELYKRVGRNGLFVAPRGYFQHTGLYAYNGEGAFLAEYREKRAGAGFDVGFTGLRSELRVGFDQQDVRVRLRVGTPALPEGVGTNQFASIRFAFDGQDSAVVPSRGLRVRSAFRYYFDTPAIVGRNDVVLREVRDVPQAEVTASWFTRVGARERLFVSGGFGTSFDQDPGLNVFRLGGPLRLGAFNTGEISGRGYVLGLVGLLHEWFRLPDILGGNAYFGGWVEQGATYERWADKDYRGTASGGVVLETILGPAFVGYSQSLTGRDNRFYVALAPLMP
jgi:NTE family protein